MVVLQTEADVAQARIEGRALAESLGFSSADVALLVTAISEVAQNAVTHARGGQVSLELQARGERPGLQVVVTDQGPGIPDPSRAMEDGYSTAGTLGLGLSGARRMVDDFELVSEVGRGTRVCLWKGL